MNKTIDYYEKNAKEYIESTINIDMSDIQNRFLRCLNEDGLILDLGCGSGRDTLCFLEKGFSVECLDASREMCNHISSLANVKSYNMRFEDICFQNKYDAIWACASLLHVDKKCINDVINKVYNSLKKDGVFFLCFKYGEGEKVVGDRFFTYYNEDSIKELLSADKFCIIDLWISEQFDVSWINCIAKKII